MRKDRHYYVSGHTRIGYYSVLPEIAKQLDCLFVVKGLSCKKSDEFLTLIGEQFQEQGEAIDYLHSPSDNRYVEGIIIRKYQFAVIAAELAESLERSLDEYRVVFLNFKHVYQTEQVEAYSQLIAQLKNERKFHMQSAYHLFGEAKHVHQQKEDIYIEWMDFKKADKVCEELMEALFSGKEPKGEQGKVEQIFFGAATPKGAVHFIDELTSHLKGRYIIKGRSGSGKSTLMRRIGEKATNLGMNVTYFLCGFDPSSVDMIIIDELKIAIIDGTAPHVINPTREGDQVVDMFELCINPVVEEKHLAAINQCETSYKQLMVEGTKHLKKAAEIQQVIDEYYDNAIDPTKLKSIKEEGLLRISHSLK